MNQWTNGRDWSISSPSLDTEKNDIDRMLALEKYTDYEFSTTDKIKGTFNGVKKQAKKDFESMGNYGKYINQGIKIITVLFIINLAVTAYGGLKNGIFSSIRNTG